MSERKMPNFAIGPAAKREVKRALLRSTNPAETIANFQTTRSLHSMLARAFGTTPQNNTAAAAPAAATTQKKDKQKDEDDPNAPKESLDTDSVLTFLNHLGVGQYEVHKRVGDALQKSLEDEIRKMKTTEPLVNLLKACWHQATTVPELRPILWAVLKQLGGDTPPAVLSALAEQNEDGALKHAEIFKALPPLLKKLAWEADWNDKVSPEKERSAESPKHYLKLVRSTLLYETVNPLIAKYCSTEALLESAGKFFVASALERRVLTTQRRALATTTTTTTTNAGSSSVSSAAALLGKSTGTSSSTTTASSSEPLLSSGKAVSHLRSLLGETAGGVNAYRPKLLHALLSMLMAMHGTQSSTQNLTGAHLHCTLVADILLSSGGPLPKQYSHVHTLASILDDAVKNGVFADSDLIKVQETLKLIYEAEQAEDEKKEDVDKANNNNNNKKTKSIKSEDNEADTTSGDGKSKASTFLKRQLNRIVTAGFTAMKDSDPQNLFLNPVTDAIAPGYSKVIKKPMCISTMENKIEHNAYNAISDWDADVRLMFKNCVDYNRGQAGQWFRGEANRQLKVYRDEILPQAKKLYHVELQRRKPDEPFAKRKREEEVKADIKPQFVPLEPAVKKRKVDLQDNTLSMPALASMLLADPFVVRLLLDRVLRSLRIDVLRGSTVPSAHKVVPSILQLLHMAEWSTKMCAIRGQTYVVPNTGLTLPDEANSSPETLVPFGSLRRYMPILIHLILEAELDKRVVAGGDLNAVADVLTRPSAPNVSVEKGTPPMQVAVALLEGIFVHLCAPGHSQDASLAVTFKKLAVALQQLTGNVLEEKAFFVCLLPAILRQKARLNRTVRDTIISTWMDWLRTTKKKKKMGSMTSAAHEYLVTLLNEWASFGNLLMPRDLLLQVASELIEVVNQSEPAPERKFAALWKATDNVDFKSIKKQYERLLNVLPETHQAELKQTAGIGLKEEEEADEDQVMTDVVKEEPPDEPKKEDETADMEEG
jgi:hypothetical protein